MIRDMHSDYGKFMNVFMTLVYEMLFQNRLSRVLPKMQSMLQSSPESRVRDWFLSENSTVIRLYGFTHQPYVLPTFLMSRIFALELIKQRLVAEDEHFITSRKHADIRFSWVVGPFTSKNKLDFPKVKNFLKEKGFDMEATIGYNPHHIISSKTQANKRKPFEHVEVVGLAERENWMQHLEK